MYCTQCGIELKSEAAFCSACGHQAGQVIRQGPVRYPKLSRPVYDKKIAGVCAGFARYFGMDVTLVRIVTVILIFWPVPIGLIAYIAAWIVMPRDPLALPEAKLQTVPTGSQPANRPV